MGFAEVLATIRTAFKPRKTVDFNEVDLHIDLEPLTTVEEVKVLEACKDLEGSEYIEALRRNSLAYAIKRINDMDLDGDIVNYPNPEGKTETKSKYLFMLDYLSMWPSTLIESLFDVLANIGIEVDTKIRKEMKFERFELSEAPPVEEAPAGFTKVEEKEDEGLTPTERMNKQVEKEIEQADRSAAQKLDQAETEALKKAQ